MTPAPKPPSVRAFEERRRRDAWLGLYGCARALVHARKEVERQNAQARMLRYVTALEEAGVKAPEESA